MKFACNVCGTECDVSSAALGREIESCATCRSSVRLRALIALLSREIFGTLMPLPEFPVLKGIRGIGMSDSPELAERLAEKFDYTNTFYHQAPLFDVTTPDERDHARYDFILSSEVMEHVPPPVEQAFAALYRMLKPDGLLLLTTPYTLDGKTAEHFPSLNAYALAAPGGRTVLVNRRADGAMEMFENLMFHGGVGSTLEMRRFSESSLRTLLAQAGFSSAYFAVESFPEFGIEHDETWSLPMAARKGQFHPPADELAREYLKTRREAAQLQADLTAIEGEYRRHTAFHNQSHAKLEGELAERKAWVAKIEREFEERTQWAADLEREKNEAIANFEHAEETIERARQEQSALTDDLEAMRAVLAQREVELAAGRAELARLAAEVESARSAFARVERECESSRTELVRFATAKWTRLGRKLRVV